MDQIIDILQNFGMIGLIIVSFTESFISPIIPDLLLIPMALSAPEKAIYYAAVATIASILGGIIGYLMGRRFGLPIVKRFVPDKYSDSIRYWVTNYGGWAIILASLAPIPYKFISISAGVFRLNMTIFILASIVGRAKRFLLEGILIFYYGPQAIELMKKYTDDTIIAAAILLCIVLVIFKLKRVRARASE